MKNRDRRRARPPELARPVQAAPDGTARAAARWSSERVGWLVAGVLVTALVAAVAHRVWTATQADDSGPPVANHEPHPAPIIVDPPDLDFENPHGHKAKAGPTEKGLTDPFLDAFNEKDPKADKEGDIAALSDDELERHFQALASVNDRIAALKKQVATPGALSSDKEYAQAEADRDRLLKQFNRQAIVLEKAVAQARLARPSDAVPRWLTGELLILVGGEPDEIFPHLKYAIARGLKRPRLLNSMALAQLEANQFADAYQTAMQALNVSDQERTPWATFVRIAFSANRFDKVIQRLDRTFPNGAPEWARAYRQDAEELQFLWEAEEKLRLAEARADDLPRVRLTIEHRRFGRDSAGKPLTTIENTGREDVILELYENEAPNTVANFLELVSKKFYDGTSFHLALPATMVAGGDPNTKNSDPADDGLGGPGYVIHDECKAKSARQHFRGSLSMVKTEADSAGSQFFFSLAPSPELNGHFTVFGRIIEGQDAVDRITPGRTTRDLGHYGKIIPGDLLVRAEVLRKRGHEYRVVKQKR